MSLTKPRKSCTSRVSISTLCVSASWRSASRSSLSSIFMGLLYAKRFALSRTKLALFAMAYEPLRIEVSTGMIKMAVMTPKDPAAVSLGRRGGKARVKNQTAEQRKESARRAAQARWAKEKEHIEGVIHQI